MLPARLEQIRQWHLRRVYSIFPIQLVDTRSGWYFLQKLEGRWSISRKKWIWRRPRTVRTSMTDSTV